MLTVVADPEVAPAGVVSSESLIDEIVRDGARRMLAAALEAEVAAYIDAHAGELDEHGRRLVVRNGHAEFVPIKIGIAGDRYFEVLSGVKPGDQVVTGPYNSVRGINDGDPVKVDTGGKSAKAPAKTS